MRSFIVNLNIIGLLAVCLFSCVPKHTPNLLLQRVDSILDEKPDSALLMLKNISSPEEMPEADRARYALLMAAAADKNILPLLPYDSLLNFALDYYDEDEKEMAEALLYKGRLQAQMGDEKAAIESSLEALEVLRNFPKDTTFHRLIYSALGLWYSDCSLYDKSLETLNLSLLYAFTPKDSCIAYHNISSVYHLREQKDSMINYGYKALQSAYRSGDSAMIRDCWHHLSLHYDYIEKEDSALYYALKVIRNSSPTDDNYANYCYNLGDLYLSANNYDSARYYLEKSLTLQEGEGLAYWSLSYLEYQLENYKTAYQYLDKYEDIRDSIDNKNQLTDIQHLVYKHQTEMSVKDEQMKSRRAMTVAVFIFIFLCFILIFIFQYRINQRKRVQERYQQALEYTGEKLRFMQQRIEENESVIELLRHEQNKNVEESNRREKLIKQLEDEKLELRAWLFRQTPIYKKIMELSTQKEINKKERRVLTTVESDKLRKTIFEIYADYLSSLRTKYPRLTDDDLLFLCLQQIGFSSLTIAMCFGFSDTFAINQRKLRLKTKMLQLSE